MKNLKLFFIAISLALFAWCTSCVYTEKESLERGVNFDADWKFIKSDQEGAEDINFDDSAWRLLDLPHDWSIEDLPNQSDSIKGPHALTSPHKMRTGYTLGGTAWYRKSFKISEENKGKIAYLQFDGIYMNSTVWVNGKLVGSQPYGYNSFYFDITPYLNEVGQENLIAVQVKNEGENARWYSGSGIYRHTWLYLLNPVHVDIWGVFVQTPVVTKEKAEINIATTLNNILATNREIMLEVEVLNAQGDIVAKSSIDSELKPQSKNEVISNIEIAHPQLWSPKTPQLYSARVKITDKNRTLDIITTRFGIRSIDFSAEKGFLLNGEPLELIGGCFHHDNGPLGAMAIDRAEERKVELFKAAGLNAIRTSHNPPSPYLLDVCDRLGMIVIDEIFDNWEEPKVSDDDYSRFFKDWWKKDLEAFIRRDRNHPSVVFWSFGNEIHESLDTVTGYRITRDMVNTIKELDESRGITVGYNDFAFMTKDYTRWHNAAASLELLDVVGYNYMFKRYEEDHEQYPERIMMATEFGPLYSFENWRMLKKHPYVIGNFAWVIMDYIGEAGVGVSRIVPDKPKGKGKGMGAFFSKDSWPVYTNFQGDIDLIGNYKPRYYHQLVVWGKSPLEMMVHEPIPEGYKEMVSQWGWPNEYKSWNWEGSEGEDLQVNVYTKSSKVVLELNGKTLGQTTINPDESIKATFNVPFESGVLVARGFDDNGNEIGVDTLRTVGKPAAVRLVADRLRIKANRNDLSYVMAEIVDDKGNLVPDVDSLNVHFSIEGKAEIAGVGNGSPVDMDSFQQPKRRTWKGKCLAIIRPLGKETGRVTLSASAEGLKGSSIEIILED